MIHFIFWCVNHTSPQKNLPVVYAKFGLIQYAFLIFKMSENTHQRLTYLFMHNRGSSSFKVLIYEKKLFIHIPIGSWFEQCPLVAIISACQSTQRNSSFIKGHPMFVHLQLNQFLVSRGPMLHYVLWWWNAWISYCYKNKHFVENYPKVHSSQASFQIFRRFKRYISGNIFLIASYVKL